MRYRKNLTHLIFKEVGAFYFKNDAGVKMHADPSILNLNVWVSSDESINNFKKNGLNIYKILPPSNWTRKDWNGNPDAAKKMIKDKKNKTFENKI